MANKKQQGVVAIEFAIIAVILFALIFTAIDLSRIMVVRALFKNTVNETAREFKYSAVETGSFNDALNIKWQEIANKYTVFLDKDSSISITTGFYSDVDAFLNDLASSSINNASYAKQPLGIYKISYPIKPTFLTFINNFNIEQTVLVTHEY